MIRSIFDTEDLREDEKAVEKIEIAAEPAIEESSKTLATVEVPQETVLREPGTFDQPFTSSGEPGLPNTENVKESEFTVDTGENFLEFERELTKIEEEARLESQSKVETTSNSFFEKATAQPEQTGIFTAALEKGESEKESRAPLEDLLIAPQSSEAANDITEPANTGFILPNRTESAAENHGFILPHRTALDVDDGSHVMDFKSESKTELIRKSGLAWTAGIAFFASVVFLLIIGWFADLLLGTAPWGAVGGIVVGSIIGFVQLFRLTSQILKNSDQ